jgi:hypothetical protein
MTKTVFLLIFFCCSTLLIPAQVSETPVELGKLPKTMDEFIALRNELAETPEGGAAVFVAATVVYSKNADLGTDMFTVALDRSRLRESAGGYKGFAPAGAFMSYPEQYIQSKPYIARSYITGTSPENGYTLPSPPLTVRVSRNKYSEQGNGDVKVFVQCSGADSPRPVTLRKNNRGIWKAVNVNSLFVGIRPPVETIDDDL